ncbi:polysaccharide lyase family 1 protein [Heterobasidion irregulare TC 32-1]|uniref:Polysaccharide lyase family 1 protein n=1 Tax=Heterobasidion irregulare (strain TC 32-1) TaxID=747525 RepID=W4JXY7_HETIT|nr:polysaccharide lyase family 1 protein [Heterobasidion irregulare TC 32-1]ETW78398.1 polysaccharide lyase family 1 protein [Heterobasidion irregulare TC 32-1]
MKWLLAVIALTVSALAAPALEKRASASDVATVGYAASAGTTGGSGGTTTRVSTLAALTSAVSGNAKKIVIIDGTITGDTVVKIGSNTSVLGAAGASLVGVGLRVLSESNVIIRNIKISKVLASAGDAIGIQASSNVWIDHNDLSSDRDHDKNCYDGLLDITHGCTGITATYNYIHDHWKASLIGHSDSNGSQDTAITVTYALNYFKNLNSRTPSFRFGHGHIFNNYYQTNNDGINTRDGAELLVENNVWTSDNKNPLYSTDEGYAVARGNNFGGLSNTAPTGTFTTAPYSYSLISASSVASTVKGSAGATLSF